MVASSQTASPWPSKSPSAMLKTTSGMATAIAPAARRSIGPCFDLLSLAVSAASRISSLSAVFVAAVSEGVSVAAVLEGASVFGASMISSNPMSSTAFFKSAGEHCCSSKSTCAWFINRLTFTSLTPSTLRMALSTCAAQAAQLIPLTVKILFMCLLVL